MMSSLESTRDHYNNSTWHLYPSQNSNMIWVATILCIIAPSVGRNVMRDCNVCIIRTERNRTINMSCNCTATDCWWSTYADRYDRDLLRNYTEFVSNPAGLQLTWPKKYGQYVCIKDNSTILNSTLIIPQGEDTAHVERCGSVQPVP